MMFKNIRKKCFAVGDFINKMNQGKKSNNKIISPPKQYQYKTNYNQSRKRSQKIKK